MRFQKLQIEQKFARISIENQMARLEIRTPMRRIRSINVKRPQMLVSRRWPSLQINSDVLKKNTARGSIQELLNLKAQEAKESLHKVVQNLNQKAKEMLETADRAGLIAQQAMDTLLSVRELKPKAELGENPVSFYIDPGELHIDWTEHEISIQWDEYQSPIIVLEPKPQVRVKLEQRQAIVIKVVEYVYTPEQGMTINTKA